jgi:Zn-dependent oligopeptidase
MQISEIKQQFPKVVQSIDRAAKALNSDTSAPQDLKDAVRELGTQSKQAGTLVQQSSDERSVQGVIEALEKVGDRAKQAVEKSGDVSPETRSAVLQAHDQISRLKNN